MHGLSEIVFPRKAWQSVVFCYSNWYSIYKCMINSSCSLKWKLKNSIINFGELDEKKSVINKEKNIYTCIYKYTLVQTLGFFLNWYCDRLVQNHKQKEEWSTNK